MKFIFPNNVFSTLFILSLNEMYRKNIIIKDSSLITQELQFHENSVAMIPSLDLINHRDLKVSSKFGLSLDGLLSNTYVYYNKKDNDIQKVNLRGDISSNDVILSKIIFQERYHIKPEIILDTNEEIEDSNYIISGNENWTENKFKVGTSLTEQLSDLLEYPYMNYLFVSKDESAVKEFEFISEGLYDKILNNIDNYLRKMGLSREINSFIKEQLNSINYILGDYEIASLKALLEMVYYYGMVDDLFDIKFTG